MSQPKRKKKPSRHFTFVGSPPEGKSPLLPARLGIMSVREGLWHHPEATEGFLTAALDACNGKRNLRCFICDEKWTVQRAPHGLVVWQFPPGKMTMVTGICEDCVGKTYAECRSKVDWAIMRDFPDTVIPTHDVEGHA